MALDITNDYLIFDNTEAITLTLKRNAGNLTVTASNALRGRVPIRTEPTRFSGALATDTLSFFIPHDQIVEDRAGESPEVGDTITDGSSNVYTIESASQVAMATSVSGWRCIVNPER